LLTNGLPLWSGNIIFFNVPEVILCVAVFGILVGLVNGAVITRFGVAHLKINQAGISYESEIYDLYVPVEGQNVYRSAISDRLL
ncbi:hypothetical protein ACSLO8_29895, partial [Escherichia coli]